jgi:hypothetical protein
LTTLHIELITFRDEMVAMLADKNQMTELMLQINQKMEQLRQDLDWIKEHNEQEEEEQGPRWKM